MSADADDLDNVDREIRLNRLRNEVNDHVESGEPAQWPTEATDNGLDYLEAWDFDGFGVKPAELLTKMGVALIPPDELDEQSYPEVLERLIQALAKLGAFLHNTGHLTDEELYRELWSNMLFEETLLIPQDASFAYHWDPLGGCSEDDIQMHLAYHADDAYRADWLKQYPGEELPEKRPLKSDRDQRLPQRPQFDRDAQ